MSQVPVKGRAGAANLARVSVGLPVYNGETYLAAAIDSVLRQSFEDVRLIISDNGSTDGTEALCRRYEATDTRVHYQRVAANRGIVWNYNEVFRLCSSEYFMWFAHDDVLAPRYLERCVEVLDRDVSVVLCYSACSDIDGAGKLIGTRHSTVALDFSDRVARFREAIRLDHLCEPWCGLTRSAAIRRTPLFGSYADYDRVMIAELALHGRFVELPEPLFFNRQHANRSHQVHASRFERTRWLDPRNARAIVFPHFRQLRALWSAVGRAELSRSERRACARVLLAWAAKNRRRLGMDLQVAAHESVREILSAVRHTRRVNKGSR